VADRYTEGERHFDKLILSDTAILDNRSFSTHTDFDPDGIILQRFNDCGSDYVTEERVNDFFEFHDNSSLTFLHINCRSLC